MLKCGLFMNNSGKNVISYHNVNSTSSLAPFTVGIIAIFQNACVKVTCIMDEMFTAG
jgi:hypothetical protein